MAGRGAGSFPEQRLVIESKFTSAFSVHNRKTNSVESMLKVTLNSLVVAGHENVICGLSLLSVLYSAPRGYSPGTPVFSSP